MARSRQDKYRRALRTGEYERKQGGYEYRWRERAGVDADGKTAYKQRAIVAQTLDELREMEKKIQKDKLDGIKTKQPTTVNDYVDKSLKARRGLRENTLRNYQYMYDKFCRNTALGKKPIQEVKKSDLISYYTKLIDKGEMSVSTAVTISNVLGPAFQLALEDDIIRKNPNSGALKELKQEARQEKARQKALGNTPRESLTRDEQKRFIEYAEKTPFGNIFKFELLTGLRVGELCGLAWDAIDWKNKMIHIKQTLVYFERPNGKCTYAVHATKTVAGTRDLPLTDEIEKILKDQKDYTDMFFANSDYQRPNIDGISEFIFFTRFGGAHKQDTLNRAIRRIVENANNDAEPGKDVELPYFSFHKLRKTYATEQVRQGCPMPVLMKKLGHSDVTTTANIYVQAEKELMAEADLKQQQAMKDDGIL